MSLLDYLEKVADEGLDIGADYLRAEVLGSDPSVQGVADDSGNARQAGQANTSTATASVPSQYMSAGIPWVPLGLVTVGVLVVALVVVRS